MINQLKEVFSTLKVHKDGSNQLDSDYKWFATDKEEIIGIRNDELTSKDVSLLTTFLTPYNVKFPTPTQAERNWRKIIYSTDLGEKDWKPSHPFRFVYFSFNKNQIEPLLFKDAIEGLFDKQVPILWENEHEGFIIEQQMMEEESISYEQIIDILMSDLYVKITFFVGPYKKDMEDLTLYYHSLTNIAKRIFHYTTKSVLTYVEAIPFLLTKQTDEDLRLDISKTILQEYIHDEETIHMMDTFFQCNLNLSETAKVLHLHRNSLQYRLDRFFEKTGIDIRQFQDAMTVSLALLARK
ncbi:PucR C-terminal helix-turn-helix domain-containing protein [Psychrobacillus sp. OK028]|uniref:PucR family transcriptional regulator n=1 Tax=Psychrobacillus sp. OK028 TaxID=1884359 RepID=UPI00088277B7|nr:helix-turn-helix domain-containing protein [Psychrobacillus sp. OK028]SDN13087.1 PucR C-terminal helix-turn-helix domain-containing protein [Psychrobacillus sp. OK028]